MIDVHVLTHAGTRPEWLEHCLRSLEGQACTVHVVDNAARTFSEGRAYGYSLGEHPFVSFVDSDDWVTPDCIGVVLEALREHRAVCTGEWAMHDEKPIFRKPTYDHHLFAARREDVLPLLPVLAALGHAADRALTMRLKPARIDHVGYFWRIHDAQHHRQIDSAAFKQSLESLPWPV